MKAMKIIRSKWLLLTQSLNINEIAQKLINHGFSSGQETGYEIDSFTDIRLKAKFIEKYTLKETLVDPFGNTNIFESIRFNYVDFELLLIDKESFLLKIQNAPKSLLSFYNSIQELLNFEVTIEPIKVNVPSLVGSLKTNIDVTQFRIISIKVSDIPISKDAKSKIEIYSQSDALEEFKNIYKYQQYTLGELKCSFRYKSNDVFAEFKKSGGITHSESINDLLIDEVIKH